MRGLEIISQSSVEQIVNRAGNPMRACHSCSKYPRFLLWSFNRGSDLYCRRDCWVEITAGWPQPARQAYGIKNMRHARLCDAGQAHEMATLGWCYDRARADSRSTLVRTAEQILEERFAA